MAGERRGPAMVYQGFADVDAESGRGGGGGWQGGQS